MDPATATDSELVAASLADGDAFAAIFDRHFDAIHRYLARRSGRDVADDIASDVFRIAFEQRRRYNVDRGDVRPWLYGIATNLLRRHHRSGWRRLRAYARFGRRNHAALPDTEAVNRRIDAEALGPALDRALAALRDGDRDVLLLFAWAELSYGEIAAALNVPVGTVRSRLHRARRVLREHLAASGQEIDGQPVLGHSGDGYGRDHAASRAPRVDDGARSGGPR